MTWQTNGTQSNQRPAQPADGTPGMPETKDVNVLELVHKDKYPVPQKDDNGNVLPGQATYIYLPLALHHITPWLIIRDFWNELVERRWFNACRAYLNCFVPKAQTARFIEDLTSYYKGVDQAKKNNGPPPTRAVKYSEAEWEVKMCWAGWNLIQGPSNRSDDPNRFNVASKVSPNYRKILDFELYERGPHLDRISMGRMAGVVMTDVVLDKTYPSKENMLVDTIVGWSPNVKTLSVIDFDAEMWVIDEESPNYVAGGVHGAAVHPTWHYRLRTKS